jgi:hypothetical protein
MMATIVSKNKVSNRKKETLKKKNVELLDFSQLSMRNVYENIA